MYAPPLPQANMLFSCAMRGSFKYLGNPAALYEEISYSVKAVCGASGAAIAIAKCSLNREKIKEANLDTSS